MTPAQEPRPPFQFPSYGPSTAGAKLYFILFFIRFFFSGTRHERPTQPRAVSHEGHKNIPVHRTSYVPATVFFFGRSRQRALRLREALASCFAAVWCRYDIKTFESTYSTWRCCFDVREGSALGLTDLPTKLQHAKIGQRRSSRCIHNIHTRTRLLWKPFCSHEPARPLVRSRCCYYWRQQSNDSRATAAAAAACLTSAWTLSRITRLLAKAAKRFSLKYWGFFILHLSRGLSCFRDFANRWSSTLAQLCRSSVER